MTSLVRPFLSVLLLTIVPLACGGREDSPRDASTVTNGDRSPTTAKGGYFTSKRFGLRLPLFDGSSWKIDDHSQSELVARHAELGDLSVGVVRTGEPMNPEKCEALLRERGAPIAAFLRDEAETEPLADERMDVPKGIQTRIRIYAFPPKPPKALSTVGEMVAIGGGLKRCFVFSYTTSTADEREVGDRLGRVRTEILDRIELSELPSISKERRR